MVLHNACFPMKISFVTHKKAIVYVIFVVHTHPVIYSCLQEHLPTLVFPNCSRIPWYST